MDLLRVEELAPGTFRLAGEIDVSNVDQLRTRLEKEIGTGHPLALDTSEVTFMDSQGLRMLIELGAQVARNGSTIRVLNCSKPVRRLLRVAVPEGIPGVEIGDEET
jgi:anti-sigma B factor antagonist